MQKIVITDPLKLDNNAYKGKVPTAKDYDTVINFECEIYENDKLVCIYKNSLTSILSSFPVQLSLHMI